MFTRAEVWELMEDLKFWIDTQKRISDRVLNPHDMTYGWKLGLDDACAVISKKQWGILHGN